MKHIKKFLGIILTLALVIAMLPINVKSVIADYDSYEVGKLQTFLNHTSGDGIKCNGLMINDSYDQDDPSTWSGIAWTNTTPKQVTSIQWSGRNFAGNLDVSNFTELIDLRCDGNNITGLDISGDAKLLYLYCNSNQMTELTTAGAVNLDTVNCSGNMIEDLDFSANTRLSRIDCSNNQLTDLYVSSCTVLGELRCQDNYLGSLDLSDNVALYYLDCSYNRFRSLDLTQSTRWTTVYCNNNRLENLNFQGGGELYHFDCTGNNLTDVNVHVFNHHINLTTEGYGYVGLRCKEMNEYMTIQVEAEPVDDYSFTRWVEDDATLTTQWNPTLDLQDSIRNLCACFERYNGGGGGGTGGGGEEEDTYYKVTFNLDGGTITDDGVRVQNILAGHDAIPPEVEKPGYVLARWGGDYTEVTEDRIITAIWYPTTETIVTPAPVFYIFFMVNFDPNGGTRTGGGDLTQFIILNQSATAPVVERDGYTFKGWDKSFDNVTQSLNIKALWEENVITHKVTFDLAGGVSTGGGDLSQTVKDGGAAVAPTTSKDGFTFEGWDSSFDNVTADITVKAVWKAVPQPTEEAVVYSVTYDLNGGEGIIPVDENNYTAGDSAILADGSNLTMDGYDFAGWAYEPGGDAITEPEIIINDDVTLYAVWDAVPTAEPTVAPTDIPADTNQDIPKTGVGSGIYLGVIMLAFGGGVVLFEVIRKRKLKNS